MGSPVKAPIAGFNLSWDERLDIRKTALEAACLVYQGKGDYLTNEYAILNMASAFDKFLKGER